MRPPLPSFLRGRGAFIAAVVIAAGLPIAAAIAGITITPEHGGSPNANRIASLYKVILYIALVVFVVVEGLLLYTVLRFRTKRPRVVPAQIRGNTSVELGWTIAAALIIVVVAVFTFAKLSGITHPDRTGAAGLKLAGADAPLFAQVDAPKPPGGKSLNVKVNGQQYIWRFTYPNGAYSYETMVAPVGTTVTLDITSQDVAHSWWIPKLGGKFDAIPGYTNHTWFKIDTPGNYGGQCAELCGRNHANMLARVKAVPVAQYQAWVTRQKQLIAQANKLAQQQAVKEAPIKTGPPLTQ